MTLQMYLSRHDGTWSDLGFYPETPPTREDGVWVQGVPPEGKSPYEPIDLLNTLSKMVEQIPTRIIRAYGVDVNSANMYLNAGNAKGAIEFIGYIWEDAQASGNPEHIDAIKPIIEFLVSLGVLKE